MKLATKDLTQTQHWLTSSERRSIVTIIASSFLNVSAEDYLAKYFDSNDAFERRLRLYLDGGEVVGYCLLTFSRESSVTVIRASAGFLPNYRKGSNTFQFCLSQKVISNYTNHVAITPTGPLFEQFAWTKKA
jgi:hypothetical protein